jgi:acyl-CoA hydrolase
MITTKKSSESLTIMTELVLPNDSNLLGNLMGGRLLYWMDIASALSAAKHAQSQVVTASVDNVSFQSPIKLGSVIVIEAKVSRAFKTSMEVHLEVFAQTLRYAKKVKSNEAFYTFVALDDNGTPFEVPAIEPETDEEKAFYEGALGRRQARLIMAGKLKPTEADALMHMFRPNQ